MNRHGSRDISAIEDRLISQTERAAMIREQAAAEAKEREDRLKVAQIQSCTAYLPRSHGSNFAAEAQRVARKAERRGDVEDLIKNRDPCVACGTRRDRHNEFGCKRWRGA